MTLTAYNNVAIPQIMYGTAWKKEATTDLVQKAVECGFTAIDTANQLKHYDEARVGEALQLLAKKGVTRDAFFLQTKFTSLDGQDHRLPYDPSANLTTQVRQSVDSSLQHLHTDHVDSYVLHGPYVRTGLSEQDWEVWAAIEEIYARGKARIIGVSNVSAGQLFLLCSRAKVKPMVVQNRCYASMGWDREVREICRTNNIVYQGFSLLTANPRVLGTDVVRTAAKRLGAEATQVIFRFAVQLGLLPLTGTTSTAHMRADLEALELALSEAEVAEIESIAG
ncbi:MAG: aldo/keto reductase [Cyanobacteria bacterium SZAS LIN-3]|nr:aldo/keto reductase [Cyanobacteria bacterium SZAS LIN-3]